MRFVAITMALTLAATRVCAADDETPALSRAVQQAYDQGWHDCAPALDKFVRFIHKNDLSYAMFGHWSAARPSLRMFTTMTAEGGTVTSFSAARNVDGTCDIAVTEIIVFNDTCKKVADDTFKDWKKSGELDTGTIYEDPTTNAANAVLTPLSAGCLVTKQVLGFGM